MDTVDFCRTKADRENRKTKYSTKPEIAKEVSSCSESIAEQLVSDKDKIAHEIALYGYCLLVRQGEELVQVDSQSFNLGFRHKLAGIAQSIEQSPRKR